MRFLPFFLLVAALFVSFLSFSCEGLDINDPQFKEKLPNGFVSLWGEEFDKHVFPNGEASDEPWLIIFYASWCHHCKSMIPQLLNVSSIFSASHRAKIALVQSEKNPVASRYGVNRFPDVYYTTSRLKRNQALYPYNSLLSPFSILEFATHLKKSLRNTSFAEDVTDLSAFSELAENAKDASFFFVIPSLNDENKEWLAIIDAAASHSIKRFFLLQESHLPPRESMSKKYASIIETAQKCKLEDPRAVGPGELVLIGTTNRFSSYQCYSGLWKERSNSLSNTIHSELQNFFLLNSHSAIERNDSTLWSHARLGGSFIGIIALSNFIASQENHQILATMRIMIQEVNKKVAKSLPSASSDEHLHNKADSSPPSILWAFVNSAEQEKWLSTYMSNTSDVPDVFIVDVTHQRFFKVETFFPFFSVIKNEDLWMPAGVQGRMLENFTISVLNGELKPQKFTFIGEVVEHIVGYVPFLEFLYDFLDRDDWLFVTFLVVVILLAVIVPLCIKVIFTDYKLRKVPPKISSLKKNN